MSELNEKDIKMLKEYLLSDMTNIHQRAKEKGIKNKFPDIYESIKDNYRIKLYMLLNDIKEVPKCKNPNCNNKVDLKSFREGFRQCCCNACVGQYQQTSKEFSEKVSKGMNGNTRHNTKRK